MLPEPKPTPLRRSIVSRLERPPTISSRRRGWQGVGARQVADTPPAARGRGAVRADFRGYAAVRPTKLRTAERDLFASPTSTGPTIPPHRHCGGSPKKRLLNP